jgi:phosphotriesterase-related protein
MSTVNTVLGPIQESELGAVLSHEHVLVSSAGIQQLYPEFIDRAETIDRAVSQLSEAYGEGLRTIVEVTTVDLGRDIKLLEEVSQRTKINIIACTGTWLDIPRVFWSATPDMIADLYVREIEVGIENTRIKAGVIKVATDIDGVTAQGEIILRAAARASMRTGVRISTHTNSIARMGEEQIAIFEEEGVNPAHVCIGHSNDTTDKDYLIGMANKGYYIGLDHYPGGRVPGSIPWEQRTQILKDLIDAGIGDKLMLSHDHSTSTTVATRATYGDRQKFNPDGYLFISRNVLPRLEELGVDGTSIEKMLVQNPQKFFFGP